MQYAELAAIATLNVCSAVSFLMQTLIFCLLLTFSIKMQHKTAYLSFYPSEDCISISKEYQLLYCYYYCK